VKSKRCYSQYPSKNLYIFNKWKGLIW